MAGKASSSCLGVPCCHGTSYSLHHKKRGSSAATRPIEEFLQQGRHGGPHWRQLATKSACESDTPKRDRTKIQGDALHIHRVATIGKVEAS